MAARNADASDTPSIVRFACPLYWGRFRFQTRQLVLSDTLLQEDIALEETADGIWSIYFYDVLLARLDERDFRLYA